MDTGRGSRTGNEPLLSVTPVMRERRRLQWCYLISVSGGAQLNGFN